MPAGAASLVATMLIAGSSAAPAVAPVDLEWRAPAGCPGRAAVLEETGRLLAEVAGAEPGAAAAREVRARGEIVAEAAGGFTLTLTLEEGERVIRGDPCETLGETAALLLAIAVDPRVLGGEAPGPAGAPAEPIGPAEPVGPAEPAGPPEPPASAGEAARGADPEDTPVAEPEDEGPMNDAPLLEADPPRAATWALGVRLVGGASIGVLPGPAGAAGVGLGLERRRLRIELVGSYAGPARVDSASNPAVAGRFLLGTGGIRLCGLLRPWTAASGPRALTIPLCGGAQVGAIRGRGEGAVTPESAASPLAILEVAAALRLALGRHVALWLDAAGVFAPLRPRFHTEPSGALWEAGPVGGRFGLGLEFRGDLQNRRGGGQAGRGR